MRDALLIYDNNSTWVDLDIVDGEPTLLGTESLSTDQRAALAGYLQKGTIPGMEEIGTDWSALYDQSKTILDIDTDIKQNIQKYAYSEYDTSNRVPIFLTSNKGEMNVAIIRS